MTTIIAAGCQKPEGGATASTDSSGPAKATTASSHQPAAPFYHQDRFYVGRVPTRKEIMDLRAKGLKTIVDLRLTDENTREEIETAHDVGITYLPIPMKPDEMTVAQAQLLLRAVQMSGEEPMLIHCSAGNRAAGMYGLYLGATHQCSAEEAIKRAKEIGLKNPRLEQDLRVRIEEEGASNSGRPAR